MRYLLIIIAILSVGLVWYIFKDNLNQDKITSLTTENNALKGNISFMEKRIEKEHADTLEVSKRNAELEELAKASKESCWSRVIPADDSVLIRLHQD